MSPFTEITLFSATLSLSLIRGHAPILKADTAEKHGSFLKYHNQRTIASVPNKLGRAAARILEREIGPTMCKGALRYACQQAERKARHKLPELPSSLQPVTSIYLNPGLRKKVKNGFKYFISPVAGIPPQTLDLLLLSIDICIANPKTCETQAQKSSVAFAIKKVEGTRGSKLYQKDCGNKHTNISYSQFSDDKLRQQRKEACELIEMLSRSK